MRKKKKGNENDENPAKEHEERAITVIRFFGSRQTSKRPFK